MNRRGFLGTCAAFLALPFVKIPAAPAAPVRIQPTAGIHPPFQTKYKRISIPLVRRIYPEL